MSAQQHDFSAPVRRESELQRKMAEFDAQKSSSKSAGGPHAPPSPDRDQGYVAPSRKGTHHSPPRSNHGSESESEYIKNVRKTGGNGRDTEEKWVGGDLPRPRVHGGNDAGDFEYADKIKVSGGRGKDQVLEWNGSEAPAITHHHVWTSDGEEARAGEDDDSAPRKKKAPKSKKYKNQEGDNVEEADGSDNEVNAHHKWRPDSEAQRNYAPEKSKKKKSSRKSSREENNYEHSGDEESGTRTYIDKNGDEVQEAADPENLKIRHNHTWTE